MELDTERASFAAEPRRFTIHARCPNVRISRVRIGPLRIRARIMFIDFVGLHPCIQSGKLNLPGKDSVATLRRWRKVAADFGVRFQTDLPCFCAVSYW